MKDSIHTTGRHPYTYFVCGTCGAQIHAPVSYGIQALRMHEDRCSTATTDERVTWRKTGRWPKKES